MDFSQAASYQPNKPQPRPYVMFITRAIEDRTVPATDGVTQMRDVHIAVVKAPGAKDVLEKVAEDWLQQLEAYAKDGRIPPEWPSEYRHAYKLWKAGEEVPVLGTAIKTWPPLTPAQRLNIISAGVLTVEDLAAANDEIKARIGMGANNIVRMAVKWLEESVDKGATAKALNDAMVQIDEMKTLIQAQGEALARLGTETPKKSAVTVLHAKG